MMTRSRLLASALFTGLLLRGTGAAAQATTAVERAILDALTPATRAEVAARMAGGQQKVIEIVETILLNKIALAFASGRIVATDVVKGVVVAEGRDGQMRSFLVDVTTLELRPG